MTALLKSIVRASLKVPSRVQVEGHASHFTEPRLLIIAATSPLLMTSFRATPRRLPEMEVMLVPVPCVDRGGVLQVRGLNVMVGCENWAAYATAFGLVPVGTKPATSWKSMTAN